MFIRIYAMPISYMIALPLIAIAIWIIVGYIMCRKWNGRGRFVIKYWHILNGVMLTSAVAIIIYITIFSRSVGDHYVSLQPFMTFRKDPTNDEIYRTTILNADMFIPFALGLAGVISYKVNTWKVWATLLVTGITLSIGIEILQFVLKIGCAEIDDVIFNMIGVLICAVAVTIQRSLTRG